LIALFLVTAGTSRLVDVRQLNVVGWWISEPNEGRTSIARVSANGKAQTPEKIKLDEAIGN
jgi:hypothetical protein